MRKANYISLFYICFNLIFADASIADDSNIWVNANNENPLIEIALPSFRPVIEKLGTAVVNISTEGEVEVPTAFKNYPNLKPNQGQFNSPFDFLFQPPQEESKRSFSSLGSGFVIHPDGLVITNNHVVEGASKISVTFRDDKQSYEAEVVGADPKTDIALLKLKISHKLDAVVLGDSESLHPGDWVIAIGNPFRLGHTATVGIVSAKSRKVPGGGPYDDFIQTDASINPGNSGGPLFNARGEVVGVNTAIFSPGRFGNAGFNIGIGFATPINLVKDIIRQLYTEGKVTRGWLGVLIQPVSPDMAEALGLKEAKGALVADVMKDSPAEKSKIKRGDVITSYDGQVVNENDDLPIMVARTPIGRSVKVDVIRNKEKQTFKVKIEELKEDKEPENPSEEAGEESKLGLSVQDITPEIASGLNLNDNEGVIVSNVQPNTPAIKAGLQRGDVILEVNSKSISSAKDFKNMTKNLTKDKPVLFLVRRDENTIFLTLRVD
jgi:serine protease Do